MRREFFLTPHSLTARNTAFDFGLDYLQATDLQTLRQHLKGFWSDRKRAAILEIESDMATNSSVFRDFRTLMQGITLSTIPNAD
jgi:2-succinyl-5-enolpyruvyl-6-hydroxy-3-cyclohexene-1-carboxylate synthase